MILDDSINADVTSFPFGSLAACHAELTHATVFAHSSIKPLIFEFPHTSGSVASCWLLAVSDVLSFTLQVSFIEPAISSFLGVSDVLPLVFLPCVE